MVITMVVLFTIVLIVINTFSNLMVVTAEFALAVARDILINGLTVSVNLCFQYPIDILS